jgi:hypothetical protein
MNGEPHFQRFQEAWAPRDLIAGMSGAKQDDAFGFLARISK